MSVLILRALISGTAKTSGGLRVRLNPDSLAGACAEQGLSFTKLARLQAYRGRPLALRLAGD
jgi:hypothetical protein